FNPWPLSLDSVMSYQQVTATEGQTVILPCTYRGEITTSCWGQGACTLLSCSNSIIMANGYRVTYQKSSHYSLRGHIERGDVSLTITKVKLSDSGVYCCRVEKRGWFNDIKITFTLNGGDWFAIKNLWLCC
uniref:Ig-like domain-containing protein n=1 Tax=Catagonus wagneri TaxID=51154 RepID=A0A8C3VYX5_9CETA